MHQNTGLEKIFLGPALGKSFTGQSPREKNYRIVWCMCPVIPPEGLEPSKKQNSSANSKEIDRKLALAKKSQNSNIKKTGQVELLAADFYSGFYTQFFKKDLPVNALRTGLRTWLSTTYTNAYRKQNLFKKIK